LDETTIIIFSNEVWSERNLIQHQLAIELSQKFNVIYLNPPVLWDPSYKGRKVRKAFRVNGNLVVLHHKHILPLRIFSKIFRNINDFITESAIKSYVGEAHEVIVWNFDRLRSNNFHLLKPDSVIYHVIHNNYRKIEDSELASSADLVLCSNSSYINHYKNCNEKIMHFPPCITSASNSKVTNDLRSLVIPKPYITYVGEINTDIDITLLKHIAIKNPDLVILLLGPVLKMNNESLKQVVELQSLPNVKILGSIESSDIHKFLMSTLACLVPYKTSSDSEYINLYPLYLHDYLNVHKHIISTIDFGLAEQLEMGIHVHQDYNGFNNALNDLKHSEKDTNIRLINDYLSKVHCNNKIEEVYKLLRG